uniref:Uncharacterized protein n=1 Tax=Arundo donax TaxID=35708 RepID=A0A0A8Y7W8_ARUDO
MAEREMEESAAAARAAACLLARSRGARGGEGDRGERDGGRRARVLGKVVTRPSVVERRREGAWMAPRGRR